MNNTVRPLQKWLPFILIVTGLIGLLASFELTLQSLTILQDPDYVTPCNLSPFISCNSAMNSAQSAIFGFPNALLGVVGFPIVTTIGFALLAGAEFKRWFWMGMQLGVTVAVAFVYWFFYQSVFVINSLCPWCFIFWMGTIPLFWYVTAYNLEAGYAYSLKHPHLPLLGLYGIIIGTILIKFWPYWVSLF